MTTKTQPITSTDYAGRTCALRTASGTAVSQGFVALSFRGERWVITGGRAPHKESSSGRVYAMLYAPASPDVSDVHESQFFPGVFDLVWVPATPAKTPAHA
jgi:hypothetical protein